MEFILINPPRRDSIQYTSLADIPLLSDSEPAVVNQVNHIALSLFVPDNEDEFDDTISPGRIGGPPKDGPFPCNSTLSSFAGSALTCAGSIVTLYEFARFKPDVNGGTDGFNRAIKNVGIAYGMIFGICTLGLLYKKRNIPNRFISTLLGVSAIALALHSRSQGFHVSGPLCALSAAIWTMKTQPHELIGLCCARVFGTKS